MKIAVVGSINMDQLVYAERIPLKGETIAGRNMEFLPGGKGANQAVAMARLGADVSMFGCVGNDDTGDKLIEVLNKNGVDTRHMKRLDDVLTGQAVITIGENDNTIVVIPGANQHVDTEYIKGVQEQILAADMIVLQNEIPAETIEFVINLGYKNGKKIVWNPAPARAVKPELIDKITYITPNEHEVCIIWNTEEKYVYELLKKYPGKLLVTEGAKGVSICMDGSSIETIPAMKVQVKDTTGAGDTLNGAFCVGISQGMDELDALRFANTAAGLSVQKRGAQSGMPTLEEVKAALGR